MCWVGRKAPSITTPLQILPCDTLNFNWEQRLMALSLWEERADTAVYSSEARSQLSCFCFERWNSIRARGPRNRIGCKSQPVAQDMPQRGTATAIPPVL